MTTEAPHFPAEWATLRVALCHDWLTGMRGGERVLEILCGAFPRAPIYTLIHKPSAIAPAINAHPVHTSWLQGVPGIFRAYRYFLPAFPATLSLMDILPADVLISTSHCVAKGARPPRGAKHLCYCFTPMRYAWSFRDEYFGRRGPKAALVRPLLAALRRWDRRTAARVDRFVAISEHVRRRIEMAYDRPADVVFPPVDLARWTPPEPGEPAPCDYDLIVSALVPYKRIDLAVRAYTRLGFPLKIVGVGTERRALRALAGPNVEFLGWRDDAALLGLYRNCRLLVFPGEEDFGIVPLEAQACGRPVVAFARGGALESVRPDVTGVFFSEQTEDSLLGAVARAAGREWDRAAIRANAERFGVQAFVDGLAASLAKCLSGAK